MSASLSPPLGQASGRTICFSDTTLRDGEQAPGVAFARGKRIAIARALDELGVDEIEVGFAASGHAHQRDIASVLESGITARTRSLARPLLPDIQAALDVGVDSVCLFMAFSPIHLEHKLRLRFEDAVDILVKATEFAKSKGLYVTTSLEDATRTPLDRIERVLLQVSTAGADQVGFADTLGVGTPTSVAQLVRAAKQATEKPVSIHCHNDFGLAVANTLAAVESGAAVVSSTINSLGERAGNASTESCATALAILLGYRTNLDLTKVQAVSKLVSDCSGIPVTPNTPIVGANAFRHESGIHVSAMLRDPRCYEPFDPSIVGASRQFALGKTSGRAGLRHFATLENVSLSDESCDDILQAVKQHCDSGLELKEIDLRNLLRRTHTEARDR